MVLRYLERIVDPLLDELVAEAPAVMLTGPRATGKTTTARRHSRSMVRLDRPAEAGVVRADPDAGIAGHDEPVLLDEWQQVPEVLGAVKRAVDDDWRPGRYVLTGSSAWDLAGERWPGTGRVTTVPMWGLTVRELQGRARDAPFLDRVRSADPDAVVGPGGPVPDIRGYVDLALTSGFPQAALAPRPAAIARFLASWVDHLVARDLRTVAGARNPAAFRRYLAAMAASTAGTPLHRTVYGAVGIDRATGVAYDAALEALGILDLLPAFASNRLDRLVRLPKRHLTDPALLGPILGVDARAVLRDVDLLGRLLDSFVTAQLRPELAVAQGRPTLSHLRDANGRHEVDLIVERADGAITGIEIKATAAPTAGDTVHLRWLRNRLGERVDTLVLFHTGPRSFRLPGDVLALPIASIWG